MKLAVSTICCADWTFDEIYASAKDLGYKGLEIRKLGDSFYAPRMKPFLSGAIDSTFEKLQKAGIEIPILSSSAVIGKPGLAGEAVAEIADYLVLAKKLGVPYIRVLVGSRPDDSDCNLASARETIEEMCGIVDGSGVKLLIETNSVFSDTVLLKELLDDIASPSLGALWDINYPYRFFGESPEETVATLGDHICFVHLKDSIEKGERIEYRLMGHGDLPLSDSLRALKRSGYQGYLSFEWVPKWSSELVEPGIVMAQYASYMQRELKKI